MFPCHRLSAANKSRLSLCHGDSHVFSRAGRVISSLSAATIAVDCLPPPKNLRVRVKHPTLKSQRARFLGWGTRRVAQIYHAEILSQWRGAPRLAVFETRGFSKRSRVTLQIPARSISALSLSFPSSSLDFAPQSWNNSYSCCIWYLLVE